MTKDNIITRITSCNTDTLCGNPPLCKALEVGLGSGLGGIFFHILCPLHLYISKHMRCRRQKVIFEMMPTYHSFFFYLYILWLKQRYRTIIFGPQVIQCYAATGLPTFSFGVVACRRVMSLRSVNMCLPCFRHWIQYIHIIMDTLRVWMKLLSRSSISSSVTWLYLRSKEIERVWVGWVIDCFHPFCPSIYPSVDETFSAEALYTFYNICLMHLCSHHVRLSVLWQNRVPSVSSTIIASSTSFIHFINQYVKVHIRIFAWTIDFYTSILHRPVLGICAQFYEKYLGLGRTLSKFNRGYPAKRALSAISAFWQDTLEMYRYHPDGNARPVWCDM